MRRVAPVRPGIAASQKSWLAEKSKPIPVSMTEVALQTCQTEKARNSASTEKIILRVATLLPDSFQKAWSSTAQCSIQLEAISAGPLAAGAQIVPVVDGERDSVESYSAVEKILRRMKITYGSANQRGEDERPVGGHRRRPAQHPGALPGVAGEDHRDLAEGGSVAYPGEEEDSQHQLHKTGELVQRSRVEVGDDGYAADYKAQGAYRCDYRTGPLALIAQRAAYHAHQRADERPVKSVLQRVGRAGEGAVDGVDHQREGRGEAAERTEGHHVQ